MKIITRFFALFILILSVTGCHQDSLSTPSATHSQVTVPSESAGEHYRILKEDSVYIHQLFDQQGHLVKEIELRKEATITEVSENVICLTYQTGTGKSTQMGLFYNIQSNQCSETYTWILDYTAEKVVLGSKNGVVVCSIFDDSYYVEITEFANVVASVPDAIQTAKFTESENTISVTYAEAGTYQLITENVKLP